MIAGAGRSLVGGLRGASIGVLAVASFAMYLLTLAPTFYTNDSAEFSAVAYRLGISHPPGYPIYVLLGRLFTLIPAGDVGYRMNLMSAVFAALAVALLYATAREWGISLAGSAAAAVSVAFSFFFWSAAVVAEVYTFQAFLLSLLLYLLAAWDRRHPPWALPMLGLFLGVSLAHHVSTLLLLPGLALLAFISARGHIVRPKTWLTSCVLVIPGLLSYLYLPIRSRVGATPNFNSWYDAEGSRHTVDLATWDGFWEVVSGKSFAHLVFAYGPAQAIEEAVQALTRFWGNFLGIGVVVGVVGAAYLFARNRGKASGLAIAVFSHAFFFVNYGAADKESMFLPAYVLWTLYMAFGYDLLFRWAGEAWHWIPGGGALSLSVGVMGAVALSALLITVNMPYVNVSHDDAVRTRAQSLFDTLPPNAVVVGGWGSVIGMIYLQEVEGQRSDVTVMVVDHLSGTRPEMLQFLENRVGTQPTFSMQFDQQLAARFRLVPFSHGYEVIRR